MEVKFEYVIEKITKLNNDELEVIAIGVSTENIATSVNPEMEMVMRSIPPQMQDLMNQQQKMFKNTQKPMIKFRLTQEEYRQGKWRVGDILDVKIEEHDGL